MLQVVEARVGGEDEAHRALLEELFLAEYTRLVGLAGLILGGRHDAEDVVQEVFAAVYRRSAPFDDPAGAVGYLRRSVVNGSRSRLRRRGLEQRTPTDPPPAGRSTEDQVVALDDAAAVAAAVARLPLRQRECLACRYQLGLSDSETASALGISVGSVKTHLHRATKRLGTMLEGRR